MIVGLPKEVKNNEHRVGLTPDSVKQIVNNGHEVFVENNCGAEIGFTNEKYEAAGATILNTPSEVFRSCGIANVGVKNIKPADLADILFTKYGIFTVPIDYANVKGCRITPNIYTNEEELDYFVDSIFKIASN